MPSLQTTTTWATNVTGILLDATGISFSVRYARPDGTVISQKQYWININDKSFRDEKGSIIYSDASAFAPGILTDAINLFAKLNTVYAQSVTDKAVAP